MTDIPERLPPQPGSLVGPVLVGVMPGQNPVVVEHAARMAALLRRPLVCAYADATVYPVDGTAGGPWAPIDPDGVEEDSEAIPRSLKASLTAQLAGAGVEWSLMPLAGEPGHALAREAHALDASMIVVGTRDHTLAAALKEMTSGSVARHLSHRQDRPVLVVPVNPRVPADDDDN